MGRIALERGQKARSACGTRGLGVSSGSGQARAKGTPMSEATVLYYNPTSRARIAHWMLEEVGIPYRLEIVHGDERANESSRHLANNPTGEVPGLIDHGAVVTEPAAICAYLADNYPRAQLAPALHEPARAGYLRWLFFAAGRLEHAPSEPAGALGEDRAAALLDALETAIQPGPYLLAERFSAADIYVGSRIAAGFTAKALEQRPSLLAYLARLRERPAFQRISEQAAAITETLKNG
jgi:glutathione S-transferase